MRKLALLLLVCVAAISVTWWISRDPTTVATPAIPEAEDANQVEAASAELDHAPRGAAASEPTTLALAVGETTTRAVVAKDTTAILAGIVEDENQVPLSGASLSLVAVSERREKKSKSGGFTTPAVVSLGVVETDPAGRFEIRFDMRSDPLHLNASHPGCAEGSTLVVLPGQLDLKFVLKRAGGIQMQILLPGDEVLSGLRVRVSSLDLPSSPDELPDWSRTVTASFESIGQDGFDLTPSSQGFSSRSITAMKNVTAEVTGGADPRVVLATFKSLRPADWTVEVFLGPAPIKKVANVRVSGGHTTLDPRLNPLDLRDQLAAVHLTIMDPKGMRIPAGFVRAMDGSVPAKSVEFEAGEWRAYVRPGTELEVSARRFNRQRILAQDGRRNVVLQPAGTVSLVLDGARVPPPPMILRVALVRKAVEPDPSPYLIVDTRGESAETIASLAMRSQLHWYDAAEFDGSGSATATIEGPGEYFVCWYVAGPKEGTERLQLFQLAQPEPARVVVPDSAKPSVRVHLDPTVLVEALGRF